MIELSVVIATYNRAERLKACLDALGAQARAGRLDTSDLGPVTILLYHSGRSRQAPDPVRRGGA